MSKKRLSIILAIFLLVQGISVGKLSAGTCLLSPPTKVSLNESQICIKPSFSAICAALFLYKLDVRNGYSKDRIKETYGEFIHRFSDAQFDLDRMDMGKKGWTRYYPFSIGDKQYIMRIFLYEERYCQEQLPVIYEDYTRNKELVFQILPGINEMLKDSRIKPNAHFLQSPVDTSP